MAKYTSNSVATVGAVLDDLSTNAVLEGWTQEQRYTEGYNGYDCLCLSYNSFYYYIAADSSTNEFYLTCTKTAHVADVEWGAIPDRTPYHAVVNNCAPSYSTVDFFINGQTIYVSLDIGNDHFVHFGFGVLDKVDSASWTGGEFVVGYYTVPASSTSYTYAFNCILFQGIGTNASLRNTNAVGYVRTEGLGVGGDWSSFGIDHNASGKETNIAYGTFVGGMYNTLVRTNVFNQRSLMTPVVVWIKDTDNNHIPLGIAPGIRMLDVSNIADRQNLTEEVDWVSYPVSKNADAATHTLIISNDFGVAFQE